MIRWSRGGVITFVTLIVLYVVYIRYVTNHFFVVEPGQVYRSAQPTGDDLIQWARQYHLKTVLNLRGKSHRDYYLAEVKAANDTPLQLIDFPLTKHELPPALTLKQLVLTIEEAKKPILIHCRDGIDRSGFVSILAAMAVGGQSFDEATKQLSWRYFSFKFMNNQLSHVMDQYREDCHQKNKGTGTWTDFRHWALHEYRPYYYSVKIAAPQSSNVHANKRLKLHIVLTNHSSRTIYADDPKHQFAIVGYLTKKPPRILEEFALRKRLPAVAIKPGQQIEMDVKLKRITQPGQYTLTIDMIDRSKIWFDEPGSSAIQCQVIVLP